MADLKTQLQDLATRAATEDKSIRTLVNGNLASLSSLNTTAKNNLVAAINEVFSAVQGAGGANIDDLSTSTLTVWSSDKTNTEIATAVANVINAAPAALNTLDELAAALGDDANFASSVTTSLAGKVSTTATETIGGVKTFSSAPLVPDASFAIAKVSGLQTALNGKITGFADPNADVIVFWDDSAGAYAALTLGAGLSITGTALNVATASETTAGVVELATTIEATTGTDTARAITAAGLKAVGDTKAPLSHTHTAANITDFNTAADARVNAIVVNATETTAGKVELATSAEALTGTDTARAVTPAGLKAVADTKSATGHTHTAANITDFSTAVPAAVPAASDTVAGKVELATTTEATTGLDTARAVTPAGVKAVADTKADLSHTHTAANITDFNTAADARVNSLVPAASTTSAGKVELATDLEALAATDITRAVTPANLLAYVGDLTVDLVATFEAGLV